MERTYTRSQGPPPAPPPPALPKRRAKPKGPHKRDSSATRLPRAPTTHTPQPQVSQDSTNMEAMTAELTKRVEEEVRHALETERADRDEERKRMEDSIKALQLKLDTAPETQETLTNRTLKEVTKALQKMHPRDEELRKPTVFREPTSKRSSSKFFINYERYCTMRFPNNPEAKAQYLSTYLDGKALNFYDRQEVAVKDDYLAIKAKIIEHFLEKEDELKMETLRPYDSSISIDEYLEEANEFFLSKGREVSQAISDLQMRLPANLQRAITIHKPKTWSDTVRWVRAQAITPTSTTPAADQGALQAMVDATLMKAAPTFIGHCDESLEKKLAAIKQKMARAEEEEAEGTLAVMGGGRSTYTPRSTTTTKEGYRNIPEGHVINQNYKGPPGSYDPFFIAKVRAKRAEKEKNGTANDGGNNSSSNNSNNGNSNNSNNGGNNSNNSNNGGNNFNNSNNGGNNYNNGYNSNNGNNGGNNYNNGYNGQNSGYNNQQQQQFSPDMIQQFTRMMEVMGRSQNFSQPPPPIIPAQPQLGWIPQPPPQQNPHQNQGN